MIIGSKFHFESLSIKQLFFRLKERIKALEKDNSQLIEQSNNQQSKLGDMVNMYENFERKSEKFILKNKTMTDTLLDLINMHHEWNRESQHLEESNN